MNDTQVRFLLSAGLFGASALFAGFKLGAEIGTSVFAFGLALFVAINPRK